MGIRLVIDGNSVYEIDEDCQKGDVYKRQTINSSSWRRRRAASIRRP